MPSPPQVCEAVPGHAFNSCLINRYEDGDSSVAWHSDNEKLFGIAPTIVSLSLGAARDFLVRRKVKGARGGNESSENRRSKKRSAADAADVMGLGAEATVGDQQEGEVSKHSFHLRNGDVLVMTGNMQRDWEHSIPRRKAVKGTRLSLTFRTVLEHDAG
jgi:alpha-ketoglutarate-dependent dioxygenase alkB family protein 2